MVGWHHVKLFDRCVSVVKVGCSLLLLPKSEAQADGRDRTGVKLFSTSTSWDSLPFLPPCFCATHAPAVLPFFFFHSTKPATFFSIFFTTHLLSYKALLENDVLFF